ncbi:MAG: GspMb/PilO family protein [Candidatus Hinthialibacter antarcticus]|nr:GspMb/PilO family protein [Candidatus Hinthialibacter antarcticus]
MASLSKREKRMALITGCIAVIGVAYILMNVMSSNDMEVSSATADRFDTLFEQMATVEDQKAKNMNWRKKIGNETGRFISEKDVSQLYAEIEKVAGQSGVQVKNYSSTINKRAKPLPQLEANLSLECQYPQLIQLLDNFSKSEILLQPSNLKASLKDANQPNLQVQLKLTTYLLNTRFENNAPTNLRQGGGA